MLKGPKQSKNSVSKLIYTMKNTYPWIEKDLSRRKAPIYAFFDAEPTFEFDSEGTIEYLVWRCSHCGEVKRQGMKTKDKGSTG